MYRAMPTLPAGQAGGRQVAGSRGQGEILKGKIVKQEVNTAMVLQTKKEKNESEEKNSIIHDTNYTLQAKMGNSIFASNYFWLAVSVSIGLIAGAIVLVLRSMILF